MRSSVEIGKIIKQKREAKKLSVTEFANRVGVNKSTISRYENGSRKIPMEDITKLASVLDVSVQELLLDKVPVQDEKVMTIAAHIDENVTEEQMKDIIKYIEFVKTQEK